MGAGQSSSRHGAHGQQDEENPPPPYHQTEGGTTPFLQQGGPERIAPRLGAFGDETHDAAPATSQPTLDESLNEALLNLDRLLDLQPNAELLDFDQFAAQRHRLLAALIHRIDGHDEAAHPLTVRLLRAQARQTTRAQAQLAALQREPRAASTLRSSLESRLHSTQARLTAAQDRVRALEKESQHIAAVAVAVKQRLDLIESGKQSPPPVNSGSHGLTKSRYRVESGLTSGLGASERH